MAADADQYTEALAAAGTLGKYPWRTEVRPRRSTVGVSYDPDGRIVLAIPPTLSPERLVRAVRSRKDTILHHHFAAVETAPHHAVKELAPGEGFDWLGYPHRLRITDTPGPVHRDRDGHGRWVVANRADLDTHSVQPVIDWYTREGEAEAADMMARWLPHWHLEQPPALRVCTLGGTRWGTYLPAGRTVVLHWPLFQLPRTLVEYVLVQQLVRASGATRTGDVRRGMDRAMPEWWQRRKRLDELGRYVWTGNTR